MNWVFIPAEILLDENLTAKQKIFLAFLLSYEDPWKRGIVIDIQDFEEAWRADGERNDILFEIPSEYIDIIVIENEKLKIWFFKYL